MISQKYSQKKQSRRKRMFFVLQVYDLFEHHENLLFSVCLFLLSVSLFFHSVSFFFHSLYFNKDSFHNFAFN